MTELLLDLIKHVTGDCGVTSLAFLAFGIWQTILLGRERAHSEQVRQSIVDDAIARTRAAEAAVETQREIVLRLIPTSEGRPRASH